MNNKCFWCEKSLFKPERTKDHFLSRPICEFLQIKDRRAYCTACHSCNLSRSKITSLFVVIERLKNRNTTTLPKKKRFLQTRFKFLTIMNRFKDLINQKLSGAMRDQCLTEIEEVLLFQWPSEIAA